MTPLQRLLEGATKLALEVTPDEYALLFVIDLVEGAVPQLEAQRKTHRDAMEDALTNVLIALLRTSYPGVIRDPDANGHVDIGLKHPATFSLALKGEAKIIDGRGFNWYSQGTTKLVQQYHSGRNKLGLMVGYCRKPHMRTVLKNYEQRFVDEKHAFCTGAVTGDPYPRLAGLAGSFITAHHSHDAPLYVVHVWVNMFAQTDEEVFVAEKAYREAQNDEAEALHQDPE